VWRSVPPSVHRTQFWSDVTSLSKIVQKADFGVCHEIVSELQFVGNKLKKQRIGGVALLRTPAGQSRAFWVEDAYKKKTLPTISS
jgi:hypothetical protein